ncbi:type II toxin-antitoxin system RelE/ParE family toxin, partial [Brucella pinnipedialis]
MKVIVSPAARDYIKSEIAYLKLRSPSAAVQLSEDLKRLKRDLGRFSQMGHFTEELPVPGIRRFVMGAYLIDY